MNAAVELLAPEPVSIAIASIKRDAELSCRARGTNKNTVTEYCAAMLAGAAFPAVVVFTDGKGSSWLADGFHRCAAAEQAGWTEIVADVRDGSRRDALMHALGANSQHGLRRTTQDKRRAVELALGNFPKLSDRKIGELVGVDHKTVSATRARLGEPSGEIPQPADPDAAVVAKLERGLDRLIAQWPDGRHDALRSYLAKVCEAMSAT